MPFLLIVAGPNGAGKTTFARRLLTDRPEVVFVNADEVARELPEEPGSEGRNFRAGRLVLDRLSALIEAGMDIALETTLSGRTYMAAIPRWRACGYDIDLYYLRLPTVEASLERIRRRVAAGGHDIPEPDVRRRFARSLAGFEACKPLVGMWYLVDSLEGAFEVALIGENHGPQADSD
jgi:predicted ABC-type ATPase